MSLSAVFCFRSGSKRFFSAHYLGFRVSRSRIEASASSLFPSLLALSLSPGAFILALSAMRTARLRTLAFPPAGKRNRRRRPTGATRSNDGDTAPPPPRPPPPKQRPKKQAVTLAWVSADGQRRAEIEADAGDELLAAATRAAEACGDEPPQGGCFSGSCGVCELTLRRRAKAGGGGLDGAPAVVRSCITVVPAGYEMVEVSPLPVSGANISFCFRPGRVSKEKRKKRSTRISSKEKKKLTTRTTPFGALTLGTLDFLFFLFAL